MLTRQKPFQGATLTDVLANIVYREPASILAYRETTPAELERIVARAVTKNKDERYQSAKELFNDLKQLETRMLVDAELTRSREAENISSGQAAALLNSIAVLPFANISSEKENDYFSEGLTEEIIMNLPSCKCSKSSPAAQ